MKSNRNLMQKGNAKRPESNLEQKVTVAQVAAQKSANKLEANIRIGKLIDTNIYQLQ